MKKGLLIAFVVGAIVVLWLGWRYYTKAVGVAVDHQRYPVRGIDVSEHTGKVDWERMKAQDVSFVFAKVKGPPLRQWAYVQTIPRRTFLLLSRLVLFI